MNKNFLWSLFLFFQMISCHGFSTEFIIGYYPSWNRQLFPAEKLDLDRLTHVMHAFAWPTADGSLAYDADLIYPKLNQRVHSAGRSILLSVGGWGYSDSFTPMAADSSTRRRFIHELFNFVLDHQYDGVDFDWEFPSSAQERKNMVLLIKELRQEFDKLMRPQALMITMAVSAGDYYGQWFDYHNLVPVVDFFGCMTYDFHGAWSNHAGHNSPLYPSSGDTDGSVSEGFLYLYKKRLIPAEKIVIGIPFYGREFKASRLYGPSSGSEVSYGYKEIVELPDSEWQYHWDQIARVPYLTHISGKRLISYDDTLSVRLKAEYAIAQKLAGVMIWALGQDDIAEHQPLLEAVSRPFQKNVKVDNTGRTIPSTLTAFPNPFNQATTLSFDLQLPEQVIISLYNINGRLVNRLAEDEYPIGHFNIPIDCAQLPGGVYLAEIQTSKKRECCKLTLLK